MKVLIDVWNKKTAHYENKHTLIEVLEYDINCFTTSKILRSIMFTFNTHEQDFTLVGYVIDMIQMTRGRDEMLLRINLTKSTDVLK